MGKNISNMSSHFKKCTSFNGSPEHWNTDNVLSCVVISTISEHEYVKEHKLHYMFNEIMGDVFVMVTKAEHPDLFNGTLK